MSTKLYLGIVIRLIFLFGTAMLFSTFTPYLHVMFGDVKRIKPDWHSIDMWYDWSAMHYWYLVLVILLFILSLINTIISIVKLILKYEPNLMN